MENSRRLNKILLVTLFLIAIIAIPVLAADTVDLTYDSQIDGYTGFGSCWNNDFYTCKSPTYLSNNNLLYDYVRIENGNRESLMYHYTISVNTAYLQFYGTQVQTGSAVGVNNYSVSYESDGDKRYRFEIGCSLGSQALVMPSEYAGVYFKWEWQKDSNTSYPWKNLYNDDSYLFQAGEAMTGGPWYSNFVCTDTVWIN